MNLTSAKLSVKVSAILVFASLAMFSIWAYYWGADMHQVVEAQELRPQILSVEPQPPFCIILDSEFASERTLIINGQNLDRTSDCRLSATMGQLRRQKNPRVSEVR